MSDTLTDPAYATIPPDQTTQVMSMINEFIDGRTEVRDLAGDLLALGCRGTKCKGSDDPFVQFLTQRLPGWFFAASSHKLSIYDPNGQFLTLELPKIIRTLIAQFDNGAWPELEHSGDH